MKQVIVVNRSLRLPVGKLAAQVAHAAIGAFLNAHPTLQHTWLQEGMPKIVVYGADAAVLMTLEAAARQAEIATCVIHDAGRTVVPEGTLTCIGLGPATAQLLDPLTGALQLV